MEEFTMNNQTVKYPCRNCVYFNTCGENTRTAQCNGRQTKSEQKKNGGKR